MSLKIEIGSLIVTPCIVMFAVGLQKITNIDMWHILTIGVIWSATRCQMDLDTLKEKLKGKI